MHAHTKMSLIDVDYVKAGKKTRPWHATQHESLKPCVHVPYFAVFTPVTEDGCDAGQNKKSTPPTRPMHATK